ncbi:MAG: ARMT1-like domain-containing protein, partial [Candidatus Thorarchaeota archaeon]
MKVTLDCAHCLLERAINQVKLATDDPDIQMNVTAAMLDFLSTSFTMNAVPSHIGTDRDLLVQELTGRDPYEELKRISNAMALDILPELRQLMMESSDPADRFRRATLIAAAANAIEFDVSGRDFDLDELRG